MAAVAWPQDDDALSASSMVTLTSARGSVPGNATDALKASAANVRQTPSQPSAPLTVDIGSEASVAPRAGGPAGISASASTPANVGTTADEQMAISAYYRQTWGIQESLDQHTKLCQQKDLLKKLGTNRLSARRAETQFAQSEVEDALQRFRNLSARDAADPAKTQALSAHLRRTSHTFGFAQRVRIVDEDVVRQNLAVAEKQIEKSRLEMKLMKLAIDDKSLTMAVDDVPPELPASRKLRYCTNCKVGGHGQRFCEYLLKRDAWRVYPHQKWFEDDKHNQYHCPLGKRLVDFADESHFSRLAMYIKGRVWLEDKTKMWDLVPDLMPDTFVIEDMKWRDGRQPAEKEGVILPWFVKEADRNWGTSIHICQRADECMSFAKPGATYVVQQHIANPVCMEDGRKCHIKFYVLLMTFEDGKTWRLYTYKDGYLSISPNAWSPTDTSKETQVTIIRTERITGWSHWNDAYPKCKAGVAEVIKRGVEQDKLEGRLGKRQFEILSADYIVDTNGNVWLFEFNMSPVLKDPHDSPDVNDGDMITAALDIVVPQEDGDSGKWDFAGEFVGKAPAAAKSVQQDDPAGDTSGGGEAALPPSAA